MVFTDPYLNLYAVYRTDSLLVTRGLDSPMPVCFAHYHHLIGPSLWFSLIPIYICILCMGLIPFWWRFRGLDSPMPLARGAEKKRVKFSVGIYQDVTLNVGSYQGNVPIHQQCLPLVWPFRPLYKNIVCKGLAQGFLGVRVLGEILENYRLAPPKQPFPYPPRPFHNGKEMCCFLEKKKYPSQSITHFRPLCLTVPPFLLIKIYVFMFELLLPSLNVCTPASDMTRDCYIKGKPTVKPSIR